jgi:DNA repair protein SbcD/Mre11
MKCKFLHVSDIHLGYQQYSHKERFNDFGRAFEHIVGRAIAEPVDFVVLGGDLFHKRSIDPPTLIQAVSLLGELNQAGIPVLAVEGNHERAHYRDVFAWTDFLADRGYLTMLTPSFEAGRALLAPWDGATGAYVDLEPRGRGGSPADRPGRVRVYGVKYYGASTNRVIEEVTAALEEMDHSGLDYVILILHAGLDDVLPQYSATVPHSLLAPLKRYVNYLALGHIHKPYEREGWIFNPGSPETCSVAEAAWPERGYYLVEVDTASDPPHRAHLIQNPRRPFVRLALSVDRSASPEALYALAEQELHAEASRQSVHQPVVELTLQGVLPFSSQELDLSRIESLVKSAMDPLVARVTNRAVPAEFEIRSDEALSRAELERQVVQDLVERDSRYRPASAEWTSLIIEVKRLVVESTAAEGIVDHLRRRKAGIESDQMS